MRLSDDATSAVRELALDRRYKLIESALEERRRELYQHTLACTEDKLATARGMLRAFDEILLAFEKAKRNNG